MLKGYKYNQPYRKISRKSKYEQEYDLLHSLLASQNSTIHLEYGTPLEARNACLQLKRRVRDTRMPLDIKQRQNCAVAIKRDAESE